MRDEKRPNSHRLSFSFGPREGALAERVKALLKACLGVEAQLVERDTTLGVAASKGSAALLFKALAGGRSSEKRVPSVIAAAPLDVVEAFLAAYVEGDGHRYCNGKVGATIEEQTRFTLENMGKVLHAAGCDFKDVVKTTVYITKMEFLQAYNPIYMDYFPEPRPARATVVAGLVDASFLIEIEAMAKLP